MSKCHCPDCNNELDRPCCAEVEMEALRKCCVQRGARMQIMREMFREVKDGIMRAWNVRK